MRRRLSIICAVIAAISLACVAAPAYANAPQTATDQGAAQGYLATPDELKALGFPQDEVDAQAKAIAALPAAEKQRQEALRKSQAALTARFNNQFLKSSPQKSAIVRPLDGDACNSSSFQVVYDTGGSYCQNSAGWYDFEPYGYSSSGFITGIFEGRVLYKNYTTYGYKYWTVWESPSSAEHYLSAIIYEDETQNCPTC